MDEIKSDIINKLSPQELNKLIKYYFGDPFETSRISTTINTIETKHNLNRDQVESILLSFEKIINNK
jgi:hypothetical protein